MSSHRLVIKDALWQLFGRIVSALFGFVITKIIASYLGPLRYGDYGTIFRFFAWWTALVDFGIYVLAVKQLGSIKNQSESPDANCEAGLDAPLAQTYGKFVGTRIFLIGIIYTLAIVVAYMIPAYTSNPFIVRGLPLAMCYSASNMYAGIQQLPLQIFRKMKRLTWSLIIARFSQLFVLIPVVYLFFTEVDFSHTSETTVPMIAAFALVIFSVVASSIGQNVEMHLRTKDLLPLKVRFDFTFIKELLRKNWKYGFSYFFSSFHTLQVLMFLGRFYPTAQGYKHSGVWALALSLIEILLIIPSSLGNSLLHKIPNYSEENKKKSLGALMLIVASIGAIIAINFGLFADGIIPIVSSSAYLGSRAEIVKWGSNQVLPFLGIVLLLSFIKQVYNYVFVALEKQNKLFMINVIGVAVGVIVGVWLIPQFGLLGGVITQLLIEVIFTGGAMLVARKENLTPQLPKQKWKIGLLLALFALIAIILKWQGLGTLQSLNPFNSVSHWVSYGVFFLTAGIFNGVFVFALFRSLKAVAGQLTNESEERKVKS